MFESSPVVDIEDRASAGSRRLARARRSVGHRERTPDEVTASRLREYRSGGDRRLRNHVVQDHVGLANAIARTFGRSSEPADDLAQVAYLGLVKAADRFDPDYGATFESFAAATIRGELRRHFRDHGWSVRVPRRLQELRYEIRAATEVLGSRLGHTPTTAEIARHLDVDVDAVIDALCADGNYRAKSLDDRPEGGTTLGDRLGGVDPGYATIDGEQAFQAMTQGCSERMQRLLHLRYLDGLTQAEIALQLGCSQVHVSRLLKQAHRHIATSMLPSRAELVDTAPARLA